MNFENFSKIEAYTTIFLVGVFLFPFHSKAQSTDDFSLNTTLIQAFIQAYEKAGPNITLSDTSIFHDEYISKFPDHLSSIQRNRVQGSKNLVLKILSHKEYFNSILKNLSEIEKTKPQLEEAYKKLIDLYPKAMLPDVHFIVGRLGFGGTITRAGLVIGLEMYSIDKNTPLHELDDWEKTVVKSNENISYIIAHELIHFQQNLPPATKLLDRAIMEGSADFLGELISSGHVNEFTFDWAKSRKEILKEEFLDLKDDIDHTGWFAKNLEDKSNRPADLGYWIGYEITKSYYSKKENKLEAIQKILNIKDYESFVKESEFFGASY